ncbi:MAG TPA: biotin/lipoyl-binding protein [Lutibacter sp.]|nr:biotin/lipoyl-binding protein [Lutibacter sp.]
MSKKYSLKVNENYHFELNSKSVVALDIIAKEVNQYQIIENDTTYDIETLKTDFSNKKYEVSVNGNKYKVQIKNELDDLIKKMGLTLGDKKKEKVIKAPMPGLILDILVSEGQEIKEGDSLLILEAMKMENILVAITDGIVKQIHVKKADAVDKKQLLIKMV